MKLKLKTYINAVNDIPNTTFISEGLEKAKKYFLEKYGYIPEGDDIEKRIKMLDEEKKRKLEEVQTKFIKEQFEKMMKGNKMQKPILLFNIDITNVDDCDVKEYLEKKEKEFDEKLSNEEAIKFLIPFRNRNDLKPIELIYPKESNINQELLKLINNGIEVKFSKDKVNLEQNITSEIDGKEISKKINKEVALSIQRNQNGK